jgi:hypothetical protein
VVDVIHYIEQQSGELAVRDETGSQGLDKKEGGAAAHFKVR